jgi:hypothetical protein
MLFLANCKCLLRQTAENGPRGKMDVAETKSRLPADGSHSSRNRLSITGICSVAFLCGLILDQKNGWLSRGNFLTPIDALFRPDQWPWISGITPFAGARDLSHGNCQVLGVVHCWTFESWGTLRRWQGGGLLLQQKPMPNPSTAMSGRIFSQNQEFGIRSTRDRSKPPSRFLPTRRPRCDLETSVLPER